MRILLVEDDNMIGHSLRQALTETGLSVDWVRDGVLAESALAQGSSKEMHFPTNVQRPLFAHMGKERLLR
jgi:DNA-binding response OmpR family regulator